MTKKCYLKNDKVVYILLYHCLNDENHTQIVSPGKKKLIRPYIYIYIYIYMYIYILIGIHSMQG